MLEGRFIAAVKACGEGAVLSHYSAAAFSASCDRDDRYPEVTVTGSATRRHRELDYRALRRAVRQAQSLQRVQVRDLVQTVGASGADAGSRT
jgi:hypothetical protein